MSTVDKNYEAEDDLLKLAGSPVGIALMDRLMEFIKFQFI